MSAVDLGLPGGLPVRSAARPLRVVLARGDRRVGVRVLDLGLACCSVEVMAALSGRHGAAPAAAPEGEAGVTDLEVLVVAGTCTDVVAPAVRRALDEAPAGTRVVSFGACSCTGGPYWDSYSVTKGIDGLVPVDLYVPGCPPRPEALVEAVLGMLGAPA